jgi:hypothetical protein
MLSCLNTKTTLLEEYRNKNCIKDIYTSFLCESDEGWVRDEEVGEHRGAAAEVTLGHGGRLGDGHRQAPRVNEAPIPAHT